MAGTGEMKTPKNILRFFAKKNTTLFGIRIRLRLVQLQGLEPWAQ